MNFAECCCGCGNDGNCPYQRNEDVEDCDDYKNLELDKNE